MGSSVSARDLPRFREQLINQGGKMGYQLVAADLNGDAKKDLLAVDEQAAAVAWFENPAWDRHVLATNVPRPLNKACCDINGDGIPEVVLVYRPEPWHVSRVMIYLLKREEWQRVVIEERMKNGHALAVGDLDGDSWDEIVCIFRGDGCRLSIYQAEDTNGEPWRKTVLDDGGIAAVDCVIEDLTGDGKPDIACIGASTGNLKLYITWE